MDVIPAAAGCHCLCVEDNIVLQRMLTKWFEKLGVRCSQVHDGQQAVDRCRETRFDLIFMDVAMPVMDGIQATKLIRTMPESCNRRTPIVAFSGLNSTAIFDCGINAFMKKPFSKQDLVDMINTWATKLVDDALEQGAPQPQNQPTTPAAATAAPTAPSPAGSTTAVSAAGANGNAGSPARPVPVSGPVGAGQGGLGGVSGTWPGREQQQQPMAQGGLALSSPGSRFAGSLPPNANGMDMAEGPKPPLWAKPMAHMDTTPSPKNMPPSVGFPPSLRRNSGLDQQPYQHQPHTTHWGGAGGMGGPGRGQGPGPGPGLGPGGMDGMGGFGGGSTYGPPGGNQMEMNTRLADNLVGLVEQNQPKALAGPRQSGPLQSQAGMRHDGGPLQSQAGMRHDGGTLAPSWDSPTVDRRHQMNSNPPVPLKLREGRKRRPRVLVVERNRVTQQFIGSYLEKLDIEVMQAYDTQAFLECCAHTPFEVVFVDETLLEIKGHLATRLLRRLDGPNRYTPLVVLSGMAGMDFVGQGLNDILLKPFNKADLLDMVEKWEPFLGNLYESARVTGKDPAYIYQSLGFTDEPRSQANSPHPSATSAHNHQFPPNGPPPPPPGPMGGGGVSGLHRLPMGGEGGAYGPPGGLPGGRGRGDDFLPGWAGGPPPPPGYVGPGEGRGMEGHRPGSMRGQDLEGPPEKRQRLDGGMDPRGNFGPLDGFPQQFPPLGGSKGGSPMWRGDGDEGRGTRPPVAPSKQLGPLGGLPGPPSPMTIPRLAPNGPTDVSGGISPQRDMDSPSDGGGTGGRGRRRGGGERRDGPNKEKEEISRTTHNEKERGRRKEITDAVNGFRRLVPGLNDKTDKATVLRQAVEYAKHLRQLLGLEGQVNSLVGGSSNAGDTSDS